MDDRDIQKHLLPILFDQALTCFQQHWKEFSFYQVIFDVQFSNFSLGIYLIISFMLLTDESIKDNALKLYGFSSSLSIYFYI